MSLLYYPQKKSKRKRTTVHQLPSTVENFNMSDMKYLKKHETTKHVQGKFLEGEVLRKRKCHGSEI